MNTAWMRGCATAIVTPFANNGAVDVERLRALVRWQIDNGVRLLVPCGTTGESSTMTKEEDELVIRTVVETAAGRARIIAGIGSNSTAVAVYNAKARQELGVDAVLAVTPYYNKPTQAGLLAHFHCIADAVPDLPVVLYNVPGRTACNMTAQTTLQLAETYANIVAVKEASGNMSQIMEILRSRHEGFLVLSGDDSLTLPLLALGADGLISVASNEAPRQMNDLVDFALAGRWEEARAIHFSLLPLMEANFMETSPGPVKAALAAMGLIEEQLRLPLVPVEPATRERLRTLVADLGLISQARSYASVSSAATCY